MFQVSRGFAFASFISKNAKNGRILLRSCSNSANQKEPVVSQTNGGEKSRGTIKINLKSSHPRIYTRTGDSGTAALFSGERRLKNDIAFETLGAMDELTSHLGLAMEYAEEHGHKYVDLLERVQCILQDVASAVATPKSTSRDTHLEKTSFSPSLTQELEEWIDEYSSQLAPLQNFILPGGGKTSAALHVARAVCRRAERRLVSLVKMDEVDKETLKYLNRLSDFLFTMARYAAHIDNKPENIYVRPGPKVTIYKPTNKHGIWRRTKAS